MAVIRCPLPSPGWVNGLIHLDWHSLPYCSGHIELSDSGYRFVLEIMLKGATEFQSYGATFDSTAGSDFIAGSIKDILDRINQNQSEFESAIKRT